MIDKRLCISLEQPSCRIYNLYESRVMGFCGKSGFLTFAGLNDTTSRQLIKKVHNSRKGKKRVCENSQTRMDSGGARCKRVQNFDKRCPLICQIPTRGIIFSVYKNFIFCIIINNFCNRSPFRTFVYIISKKQQFES